MTAILIGAAGVLAVFDWVSVWTGRSRIEALAKPAVMIGLIAAALSSDGDEPTRVLIVAGLALGLVGDVLLLPAVDNFVGGLGAFLIGHVAYAIGFVAHDVSFGLLAVGVAAAAILAFLVGRPVLAAVSPTRLARPVQAYFLVISAMVATAIASGSWWFALGAIVFALSDGLLGHDKFATPRADRRTFVHVLYHLGQMAIVAGLA